MVSPIEVTPTMQEEVRTEETVRIEELNPILWWFIAREEKGEGTYKRVMQGEYKLIRDENGRIIDSFDAEGKEIDAVLFKKGGYHFGWESVEYWDTNPDIAVVSVPVMNLGEIVEPKFHV